MKLLMTVLVAALAVPAGAQAQLDDLWISRWGVGGVLGYRPSGAAFATINSPGSVSCIGVTAIGSERVAVTRRTTPNSVTVFERTGAVVLDFPTPEVSVQCGDLARFADGTFAVCDTSGDVELYTPAGAHIATWDTPSFLFPFGAWVDARDRLWISDWGHAGIPDGRILAFDRAGTLLHNFPLAFEPGDLVVEPSGEIWVTDRLFSAQIYHLDAAGSVLGSFSTGMGYYVEGIGLAVDGTLWVCSTSWAIARHFARDGTQLGQFVIPLGLGNVDLLDIVRSTQPPESYCTAGTTTHGCQASLSTSGHPSLALTGGFSVTATQVEGALNGTFFYSVTGAQAAPWASGSTSLLCIRQPLQRTLVLNSGGALGSCAGVLSLDLRAWEAANPTALGQPLVPGEKLWIQAWFRDPAAPRSTNLSNAVVFDWEP